MKSVDKVIIKSAFAMVSLGKLGFSEVIKKSEITEIGWCAASITILVGFNGGYEEGV